MMKHSAVHSPLSTVVRRYTPWVLLLIIIGFVLFHYVLISEEERVRRMVNKGAEAVEDKSVLRCANLVAQDYSDSNGFDKRLLVDAARRMFENYTKVEAKIAELTFDRTPTRLPGTEPEELEAQVRLRMKVLLHGQEGILQLIDDAPKARQFVLLTLVKRNGRWLLQRMEFENVQILNYQMQ